MKKVTITDAHCGGMFQVEIPTSGVQHSSKQYSIGDCRRNTRVYSNNGNNTKNRERNLTVDIGLHMPTVSISLIPILNSFRIIYS